MSKFEIIREPHVTEKTTLLKEALRVLTFRVSTRANKIDIKKAVETLFKVKVSAVRTAVTHGKKKRQGRHSGRRPDWKKAYVTLKEGEQMPEIFETR
ncbi:MAG: 50S ribosomal protein L23 [Acidobacteriota bacterium]